MTGIFGDNRRASQRIRAGLSVVRTSKLRALSPHELHVLIRRVCKAKRAPMSPLLVPWRRRSRNAVAISTSGRRRVSMVWKDRFAEEPVRVSSHSVRSEFKNAFISGFNPSLQLGRWNSRKRPGSTFSRRLRRVDFAAGGDEDEEFLSCCR